MTEAYFTTRDGSWFVPSDLARGPWDPDACHGGPPTALLVRAVEGLAEVGTDQRLARLCVELTRPVPMAGFTVTAEVRRRGRTATTTTARIVDGDGRTCAIADGLHLTTVDLPTASAPVDVPDYSRAEPGEFPIARDVLGDLRLFSHSIEVRYPPGDGPGGPTTLWMRTVPILPDEEPSPFQRLAPLADCGNGTSWNVHPSQVSCVNADLLLTLVREPVGDWFASRAATHSSDDGIGFAGADLFDVDGLVGRVAQTLVLRGVG